MNCQPITLKPVRFIENKPLGLVSILQTICNVSGFSKETILKDKQTREIAEYRFIAFYFLRNHDKLKLKEIAKIFRKDHSTIIYGLRTHDQLVFTYPKYKEKYWRVRNALLQQPLLTTDI